ncbi:MAG: ROK family protein [Pseudomonadota bacterium]
MQTIPPGAARNFDEPIHGRMELPSLTITGYSLALHDPQDPDEGFIGDRASRGAFTAILDAWRAVLRRMGDDPLGRRPSADLGKKRLDALLQEGGDAAAVIRAAVEDYALQLASVVRRFQRQQTWHGVDRIVVGGGFQQSRVGRLAVKRTAALLRQGKHKARVDMHTLHHDADEGGLIGWLHLAPPGLLRGYDALLAVDIGGTNLRCGIVRSRLHQAADLSKADVVGLEKWAHADDEDATRREDLVEGLAQRLAGLIALARRKRITLAPFIGVACPGLICEDGSIAGGAQNLPGNWESARFHLPGRLVECFPSIGGGATQVLLHNDAVVQGLSELPRMVGVKRWAILTVGTGLGNASFVNRR